MVLQGQPCGRVGRCRVYEAPLLTERGFFFSVCPVPASVGDHGPGLALAGERAYVIGVANSTSLLPREHGAYMELSFPMLTVLWVGELTAPAIALSFAVWCGFLAHEPAAVLLGMRGPRRKREDRHPARTRLVILLLLGAAAASVGCALASTAAAVSFAVLGVAGGAALTLTKARKERTFGGQFYLASLLALVAVPIGLAAELPASTAGAVAGLWVLIHLLGTLAARGIALQRRVGPGPVRRAAALAVLALGVAAGVAEAGHGPWVFPWAIAPPAVVTVLVALRPPGPERMRAVGLALVGASVLTTLALVVIPM